MTPVGLGNGPACWICEKPLDVRTDGNGYTIANCPRCRPEIEAMRQELAELRKRLAVTLCPDCRERSVLGKGRKRCVTCQARRVAAKRQAIQARRDAREAARAQRNQARFQIQCMDCPTVFAYRRKGHKPKRCPVCQRAFDDAARAQHAREVAARRDARQAARAARLEAKRQARRARPNLIRQRGEATRARVSELRRRHPQWTQKQVAAAAGVSGARVGQILKEQSNRKEACAA